MQGLTYFVDRNFEDGRCTLKLSEKQDGTTEAALLQVQSKVCVSH